MEVNSWRRSYPSALFLRNWVLFTDLVFKGLIHVEEFALPARRPERIYFREILLGKGKLPGDSTPVSQDVGYRVALMHQKSGKGHVLSNHIFHF